MNHSVDAQQYRKERVSKVLCDVCGRLISSSNIDKHLRAHFNDVTDNSYHVSHDDLNCIFCNKSYKNLKSLVQHEIRCKQNPNRIKPCNNLGQYNRVGHVAWNRGLTKNTDERIDKCAKSYKKNHELGLHKDMSGNNNPSKNQVVRDKISETCLMKSKNGDWHTSLAKNMHYNYKNIDLHGTWELRYAMYLDMLNISWKRNTERFPYIYNGKFHYYTPDFYLVDTNEYVEIKGLIRDVDYEKWRQFPTNKTLVVLTQKELSELGIFDIDINNYFENHK